MGNFAHVPNYVTKAEDPQGGLLPLLKENADLQAEFKVNFWINLTKRKLKNRSSLVS
jgi:hypothetical protein